MTETVSMIAAEGDVLENSREIIWITGELTADGAVVKLPLHTRLLVLKVWAEGSNSRVLFQIADYLDVKRRRFYHLRRVPEFAAGNWGATCFKLVKKAGE